MSILTKINRTNELKIALTSILKQVHSKAYYRKAPAKTDYPYLTYYLRHTKDGHQYDYFWEVHVWTRDIKLAEELADNIEGFDKCSYKDYYQTFDIDLESRNNVEDEDKEIQHIVLLFNLTYFDVKG
ncbi:hypothetical protein [Cellulosilyticum lentocellum]|uniref:Uncharacterized protein n=1 Tax=Cellulosilyticum lentocellum (strain ATCC 49066 / DSM 5427 / NCIMB 11756 / RHM5) TaxID=642492 RepID=F2JND0_CELLD|nr:hypothetical protein [Cellulosilyticum lentocellum]ADZ83584.1 hypothetical protein Clole_1863 [Cellulosilyticum lentocellum DSM 5427]